MCIASARHEQLERDKVVSKRSSWHRRSNLFALLHWILQSTKCHELECWPSRPSDQMGRILFQTSRETRSTAGFDRNIRHGLQRGFREWNTKRKTRLETTSTDVHRPTMSNQKLKSLTSHKATETNQVQRRPPQSHGILRFTKKTPKKNQYNVCRKIKMLQSKLLDRSLCFSIVHIAKQTAQARILRFQCELIQSCKATLQSSPKFFLWHLFWSVHVRSLAPNSAQPWLAY